MNIIGFKVDGVWVAVGQLQAYLRKHGGETFELISEVIRHDDHI